MTALAERLACPRCGTALTGLRCGACQVTFPVHDGVPWLVADPDATRLEWRNRWQMALADLERAQRAVRLALEKNPRPPTRARLDSLAAGYAARHRSLKLLLGDLGLAGPADLETYLALKTRLPSRMSLTGYEANVFRDWCWGEQENETSLEAVRKALGERLPGTVLVLGAGAGRLAYDVHRAVSPALTVALELNPWLTTITKRMARGETLTLTELPLAPRAGERSALTRTLRAPAAASDGFEVVLADAIRPPFLPGTFDLVLTPWLLDVIDTPAATMLALVNGVLTENGRWIYHGSLAFNRPDVSENLNLDELTALALETGFEGLEAAEETTAYLDCPDSRHGRRETVITLAGNKRSNVPPPSRQQTLPDWIARGRGPVPLLPAFQSQAMATRIHAFIMSLIDGQRSLKDMAAVMEAQRLMPQDEAETAIRGFLIKMLNEASTGQGL